MYKRSTHIIPFTGEKEKWCIWSGKFMARSGIKGYYVLLTGDMKTRVEKKDKKLEGIYI